MYRNFSKYIALRLFILKDFIVMAKYFIRALGAMSGHLKNTSIGFIFVEVFVA